jgi:hypothetical protein
MAKQSQDKEQRPIIGFACNEERCIPLYELPFDETVFDQAPSVEEPEPDD